MADESDDRNRVERENEDIEIYKAVRAHEVMLNQAMSAFEHAVYLRLAALNGGAAAAFVTLLGALLKSHGVQPVNVSLAATAVGLWLFGLVAASVAAVYGFRRQRAINQSYRVMREEIEHIVDPRLARIVRGGEEKNERQVSREPLKGAEALEYRARRRRVSDSSLSWFKWASVSSGILFVAGVVLALLAVLAI